MNLEKLTATLSAEPTPNILWQLRSDLLQEGYAPSSPPVELIDHFYEYLSSLQALLSAQTFTKLAAWLRIGAAGTAALEGLLTDSASILGAMREGLDIVATQQYVKGAEANVAHAVRSAGYYLYGTLWQISASQRPDQPITERRQLLDQLFIPLHDKNLEVLVKAVLIGRLFQTILLIQL